VPTESGKVDNDQKGNNESDDHQSHGGILPYVLVSGRSGTCPNLGRTISQI
jgi:hypothetical protein